MEKEVYNSKEVRIMLGVCRPTLRKFIDDGTIKAVKHGRNWFFSKAEVARMLRCESQENKG